MKPIIFFFILFLMLASCGTASASEEEWMAPMWNEMPEPLNDEFFSTIGAGYLEPRPPFDEAGPFHSPTPLTLEEPRPYNELPVSDGIPIVLVMALCYIICLEFIEKN